MSNYACRFLRPYLYKEATPARITAYTRFFGLCAKAQRAVERPAASVSHLISKKADYQKRVRKLESVDGLQSYYPRISGHKNDIQCISKDRESFHEFVQSNGALQPGATSDEQLVQLYGRVISARRSSSKLIFVTIRCADGDEVQGMFDLSKMQGSTAKDEGLIDRFSKCVRRGDWLSITGHPYRTERGELSVLANSTPSILAPSLNQIPDKLDDEETLARYRHVDLILNKVSRDVVILRHVVETALQEFLNGKDFIKVNTPILTVGAGGAIARPFRTKATELPDITLDLRIAPELYLKRLIVGGLKAVYEIGPAFRNEGVDATHNPEFTICEFYKTFTSLDELIELTQLLFSTLQERIALLTKGKTTVEDIPVIPPSFHQIEFIPSVQDALRNRLGDPNFLLPDLMSSEAVKDVKVIFDKLEIPVPANANLPRLLDALVGILVEPTCKEPTFIKHHPAVMSPLAKSFTCPTTQQLVSARAELFIQGVEYANMYEEENSPFEQRRKFEEQLRMRGGDGETSAKIDESYIEALEWGMPPTGGWGCGVDRIVMLFAGTRRIADVLPFGTIRNVVGMAQNGKAVLS